MKTHSTRTTPVAEPIPRMASAAALRIEMLSPLKSNFTLLKFLVVLCGALAATSGFGQTTRTWTGGNGTGIAIGATTNWSGSTLPNSATGDIAQWDGSVVGNLFLTADTANGNLNNGTPGVSFNITAGQTSPLNISSAVAASGNIALNGLAIASGAGAFSLGNGSANVLNPILRPSSSSSPGPLHDWTNNSASAAIIYPNVRWQSGGGNPHQLRFNGTGDWIVTNSLIFANGVGMFILKAGSGTFYWAGPSIAGALGNNSIASPLDFEGGTVVLRSGNPLTTQAITNNGALIYNAPSASQTLSGAIRGSGTFEVSAGTLTLSGASTYTNNTTLSGSGTLILGSAHTPGTSGPIGIGGTVFFNGGALQFSVNNTFDYSSRFATSANQAYAFNTGGQNVTFTNTLGSSGGSLTKSGSGTLTLAGTSSYTGATTNSAGKLVIQGVKTGSGDIVVANSTTLGVYDNGTQITPGTLTVGPSASASLEFNNVNSTSTAIIAAGTVSAGGAVTVNVNSGSFAIGQSYPLLSWTSGSPAFSLGTLTGAGGNLSVTGNTLYLNITSLAFVWTGLTDGNWDTTTGNNWKVNGVSQLFNNGGTALFDDTAAGQTSVVLNAAVAPASVTVNSSTKTYSITSSGANVIAGSGSLTKNGNSTLTLAGGVNSYSGPTAISGGTLSVGTLANGGSASDIGTASSSAANLVLNGGSLQYTGVAQDSDHLFTLGTGNGTLNASGSGALTLTNHGSIALSGSGARTLTLTGASTDDNTVAAVVGDNGGATALTKSGAGKWVLTGNNVNSGVTTIAAGTLQVGAGGASGALGAGNITDNGSLIFNTTSTLTNSTIVGSGSLTVDGGGTVVLPGDNTYSGGTTINAGTLQVGVGGATGKLNGAASVANNGTIIYNSTSDFSMGGFNVLISGSGNLIKRGSGLLKIIGNNSYTGWTLIEPGARLQVTEGNQGAFASSVVTNNGLFLMTRQDNAVFTYAGSIVGSGTVWKDNNNANIGDVTFTGNNSYSGGTVIGGGNIIVGDGSVNGWITGDVLFTNSLSVFDNPRTLTFNRSDDVTFSGNITFAATLPFGNRGIVAQNGSGMLTLTGNNTHPGGTTINAGILQVGNGGTSGAIGTGPCTDNTLLIFNRSDALTYGGMISGNGSIVKTGAGTLTLNGTNNVFGSLTVSNGTLFMNNLNYAAPVAINGGAFGGNGTNATAVTFDAGTTLVPGSAANSVGTITFSSDLTIGGDIAIDVNKSLVQSNDLVIVGGTLSNTGTGTLTVANGGPALTAGDKFTLFSQPLSGGAAMTVIGAGATWQNDLAVDGSITALTVASTVNTNPPVVRVSVSGNTLSLAWPTNLGWTLQTNSVGLNATNQWFTYPGSSSLTNVNISINPAKTNVFFRMVYP